MTYIAVIDEASCVAQGDCEELAPDVFHVEDVATIIGTGSPDVLMSAARSCPTGAIVVIDDDTGEQVCP